MPDMFEKFKEHASREKVKILEWAVAEITQLRYDVKTMDEIYNMGVRRGKRDAFDRIIAEIEKFRKE